MTTKQLKNRCRVIQGILDTPDFYSYLCAKADNDINKVIPLLSRIIDYTLNSNIEHINFNKIPDVQTSDYVIYPTNSYNYEMLSLFGLSFFAVNGKINKKLDEIDKMVSVYPIDPTIHWFNTYDNIEEAIKVAHTTPSIVFSHILKQPENDEQPIVVGATESSYYLRILEKRLSYQVDDYETAAKKAEKTISSIVEKDSLLVVIPKDELDDFEKSEHQITDKISRNKIGLIKIPSRYQLLQICAQNRNLKNGTEISIKDGQPLRRKTSKNDFDFPYSYTRYEKICVDEDFEYSSDLLTGDARYDMDIIYGSKDHHKTKDDLSENPDANIKRIKSVSPVLLTIKNNKVWINNGRHRLVYLKNYYLDQQDYYASHGKLDFLKDYCTIIANVVRTFEDEEVLRVLTSLKEINPSIQIYKNTPLDDEISFVIMIHNHLYRINNKAELLDFYNGIKKKKINPLYDLATQNGNNHLESKYVMNYIVNKYATQVTKLTFSDIIEFIKFKGIKKDGLIYGIDYINIDELYNQFSTTVNIIHYYKLSQREIDLSKGLQL